MQQEAAEQGETDWSRVIWNLNFNFNDLEEEAELRQGEKGGDLAEAVSDQGSERKGSGEAGNKRIRESLDRAEG